MTKFPTHPVIIRKSLSKIWNDPHGTFDKVRELYDQPWDDELMSDFFTLQNVTAECDDFPSSSCFMDTKINDPDLSVNRPDDAVGERLDTVLQSGCWLTKGHIETGGACALSTLVCGGLKFWLFGYTQGASRNLTKFCDRVDWILNVLSSKDRSNGSLGYVIQEVGDTVMIPPLCAHTVLTLPAYLDPRFPSVLIGETFQLDAHRKKNNGMAFVLKMAQAFPVGVGHGRLPSTTAVKEITQDRLDDKPKLDHLIFLMDYGFQMPTVPFLCTRPTTEFHLRCSKRRARKSLGYLAVPKPDRAEYIQSLPREQKKAINRRLAIVNAAKEEREALQRAAIRAEKKKTSSSSKCAAGAEETNISKEPAAFKETTV